MSPSRNDQTEGCHGLRVAVLLVAFFLCFAVWQTVSLSTRVNSMDQSRRKQPVKDLFSMIVHGQTQVNPNIVADTGGESSKRRNSVNGTNVERKGQVRSLISSDKASQKLETLIDDVEGNDYAMLESGTQSPSIEDSQVGTFAASDAGYFTFQPSSSAPEEPRSEGPTAMFTVKPKTNQTSFVPLDSPSSFPTISMQPSDKSSKAPSLLAATPLDPMEDSTFQPTSADSNMHGSEGPSAMPTLEAMSIQPSSAPSDSPSSSPTSRMQPSDEPTKETSLVPTTFLDPLEVLTIQPSSSVSTVPISEGPSAMPTVETKSIQPSFLPLDTLDLSQSQCTTIRSTLCFSIIGSNNTNGSYG
jgi:hypothetical protein